MAADLAKKTEDLDRRLAIAASPNPATAEQIRVALRTKSDDIADTTILNVNCQQKKCR